MQSGVRIRDQSGILLHCRLFFLRTRGVPVLFPPRLLDILPALLLRVGHFLMTHHVVTVKQVFSLTLVLWSWPPTPHMVVCLP